MRNIYLLFVFLVFLIFIIPSISIAEYTVTGVVIEQSENKEFIQVKDNIYKVGSVWLDDGVNKPKLTSRNSIIIGSIVQLYPGKKTIDYWQTKEAVLFSGIKEVNEKRRLADD